MTFWKLVQRSLLHYRHVHLGVVAAAAFATAVLVGALLVGDSVRYTLARQVEARLGRVQRALPAGDRFFRADLADRLANELQAPVAAVLQAEGLAVAPETDRRANRVQIIGVDEGFWTLGPTGGTDAADPTTSPFLPTPWTGPTAVLNRQLAQRLNARPGDQVVIRIAKPGVVPRDVPVTGDDEAAVVLRAAVQQIIGEDRFGRFSLQANQLAALNVFVPLAFLSEQLGLDRSSADLTAAAPPPIAQGASPQTAHGPVARANLLLVGANVPLAKAQQALRSVARLDDLGLELRQLPAQGTAPRMIELRSRRVFIAESIGRAALQDVHDATGVLTYFVNELRCGNHATPYSMVAALTPGGLYADLVPRDMPDNGIVINRWLADDLQADVGDSITLRYFVVGPDRRLLEESRTFTVHKIVPIAGPAADRTLMPDFPGLVDTENCRDWKPGIDIDYDKIREKDEAYWDTYRGTPKAFITLNAGRTMWRNRFGNLTAVRYPAGKHTPAAIAQMLAQRIDPAGIGLRFVPIRQWHERAGRGSSDFGSLFLGLSMFLIGSAIVLLILVFMFGVERRIPQLGMLLAVGLPRRRVGRLLLAEGATLATAGAVLGMIGGLIYTRVMIWALATVWSGAVAGSAIRFHASALSLVGGAGLGIFVSLAAITWTVRRVLRRHAAELMAGSAQIETAAAVARRGRWGLIMAGLLVAAAIVLPIAIGGPSSSVATGVFFGSGSLLLAAAIAFSTWWLAAGQSSGTRGLASIGRLAQRNRARRRGRSLAVVILLACGVFMVVAVGANRKNPARQIARRDGPAGAFTLYGESAIGIVPDLDTPQGRRRLGLDEDAFADTRIVSMRLRPGDDASCLNLNRAQQPRLLGVDPDRLAGRFAFRGIELPAGTPTKEDAPRGWTLLRADYGSDVVPAIGDYPTVYWALHKRLGDEIEYVDDRGRTFRLRIVGMLGASIFQGALLIDERAFIARFGSIAGRRIFLVDAPATRIDTVADVLRRGLRDYGLELETTAERLARFNTIENTYLSIFQLLGSLGLAVGSVGLGLVVLLNLLERRGELAMLQAVGLDRPRIKSMLIAEHAGLVAAGLAWGLVAAIVAVWPALQTAGSRIPIVSLALILLAIAISSLAWIVIATSLGLHGRLLDALRSE